MEFSDRDSRHNRKSMISKFSIFLSHSVDCWCGMWDMWWCWSQWQCSGWSGRGHLSTCAGWCSPSVSSLQSLVSAAVKTYSTISSWIQVHWAAELQFAVPAVKVSTKFRDKFHNWQYLEKVPTRAFSLKISINSEFIWHWGTCLQRFLPSGCLFLGWFAKIWKRPVK